jgi:uncharacterized membrane protein
MIVLGMYREGIYDVFLFLHLLSVLVAFAPAFVNPVLATLLRREGGSASGPIAAVQARATQTIYFPAAVATGIFGILMVLTSDDVIEFSETWISLAFLVWFGLLAVVWFKILPAERELGRGPSETAEKALAQFGGIGHLLIAVMLYLMVFQPGGKL